MSAATNGNKVKFGLKNVYYAKITETVGSDGAVTVAYGTPKMLPGAVSLSLDPVGDAAEFYADDNLYYSDTPNQGYSGSLEVAQLTDDYKKDILGYTADTNGVLFENKDAKTSPFALLYEFSGDKNKVRHVLYKVTGSRPKIEGETRSNSTTPKTDSIDIVASAAADSGDVKARALQDDTPYATWFTTVYKKTAASE